MISKYITEDGLDFRDPYEREIILQQRREELAERLREKKERNKTYLKGQRGVRRYYDYDIPVYEDKDGNEMFYRIADGQLTCKIKKNSKGTTIDYYDKGQITDSFEYDENGKALIGMEGMEQLDKNYVAFLKDLEEKDCIFPEIDYRIYA